MAFESYNPDQTLVAQYKAATVIGLGATGYSVVRYLRAHGLKVTVLDSSNTPPLAKQLTDTYPEVAAVFGAFESVNLQDAELIVASPGVSLKEPMLVEARRNGSHIVGDIELFLQENQKPVIAITGSNGKSTVTTLVGEMIKASGITPLVAGNIGTPVLDALTDGIDYEVAVLELSSFQLETTSHVPAESSAILNISADHMDRYDSMGDYVLAKARVLRGARRAVLPRHDEQMKQITNVNELLSFELDEPANDSEYGVRRQSGQRWLVKGDQRLMKLKEIPMAGLHNVKNVLSAFALVEFLDLPVDNLVDAIRSFHGLPHRMQTVAVTDGISWVNDSKATNVGATSTALRNLESPVIWIAGGQGKGADFSVLKDAISSNIKLLILFGEDATQIQQALQGNLPIEQVKDMQGAVDLAGEKAVEGDIVLLSPACASFDMFDSFEDRGEAFSRCVEQWAERGAA